MRPAANPRSARSRLLLSWRLAASAASNRCAARTSAAVAPSALFHQRLGHSRLGANLGRARHALAAGIADRDCEQGRLRDTRGRAAAEIRRLIDRDRDFIVRQGPDLYRVRAAAQGGMIPSSSQGSTSTWPTVRVVAITVKPGIALAARMQLDDRALAPSGRRTCRCRR